MDMIRRRRVYALVCLVCLTGCSMTKEQRDQLLGGLGGAAAGAAVGALAGRGDPRAIAAGAVAGGAVGWGAVKLTQYHAEQRRSASEEASVLGYNGQETLIKIREASAAPQQLSPGDTVTFDVDYAVLAPSGTRAIPVQESWVLEKDGKRITQTKPQTQQREPGGWHTTASLPLPKNAEKGTYIVKNQIGLPGKAEERIAYFTVL